MKGRVHFIHGILDSVGKAGLLKLVPYFQQAGFDTRVPDYGLITACETRIVNPIITRCLRPYVEPGDVIVGHSNGCAIAYDLVAGGQWGIAGLILINAALKRDIRLPTGMWADVYYNRGDEATVAAIAAAAVGLVDPVWGEMGHAGYSGGNKLIMNINCGHSDGLPPVSGHTDIFTDTKIAAWGPFIVKRATLSVA